MDKNKKDKPQESGYLEHLIDRYRRYVARGNEARRQAFREGLLR